MVCHALSLIKLVIAHTQEWWTVSILVKFLRHWYIDSI